MTYHPRFATQLRERPEQQPCDLSRGAAQTVVELGRRSAVAELRLAHAQLSRRFPDESFSLGSKEPSAKTAVVLLLALIAAVAVIAARSIG